MMMMMMMRGITQARALNSEVFVGREGGNEGLKEGCGAPAPASSGSAWAEMLSGTANKTKTKTNALGRCKAAPVMIQGRLFTRGASSLER